MYAPIYVIYQVKSVNGKWVPADPIPETILVNTGDLLEFWSGGLFPATVCTNQLLFTNNNIHECSY
jgi:hypothetical protein